MPSKAAKRGIRWAGEANQLLTDAYVDVQLIGTAVPADLTTCNDIVAAIQSVQSTLAALIVTLESQ